VTRVTKVDTLDNRVRAQLPRVFSLITEHIETGASEIPEAGVQYSSLWHVLGAQFGGGKSIRPSLTLAAYHGLGGKDDDAPIPVAAAMEMLHIAMLVHDDIIDRDEVRRGRPNIAGTRRAELASSDNTPDQIENSVLATALLGGDVAIASAYDLIASAPLPAHHRIACLGLVTRAIRTTIAGELLDAHSELVDISDSDPLLIAQLKTATYTCVVPLLAGAELAGGDPTLIAHLEEAGLSMGLSFQLIDDDLGIFGDPEVTGKSVISDLRAGKRTEMVQRACTHGTPAQVEALRRLVGDPHLDDEGAAQAREILESSGARQMTLDIARDHARKARTLCSERIPAPLSGYLTTMIGALEERVS